MQHEFGDSLNNDSLEESKIQTLRQNTNASFIEENEETMNSNMVAALLRNPAKTHYREEEKQFETSGVNAGYFDANSCVQTHIRKNSAFKENQFHNDTSEIIVQQPHNKEIIGMRLEPSVDFEEPQSHTQGFTRFQQPHSVFVKAQRDDSKVGTMQKVQHDKSPSKITSYFDQLPEIKNRTSTQGLLCEEVKSPMNINNQHSLRDEGEVQNPILH